MNPGTAAFSRLIKHPLQFRLFLLSKLPSAYFTGVRVKEIDEKKCVVTVPYKWFSRNPFRSTYFASLAMAAEMSTGALAMGHLYKRKPSVSMLLVKLEANYFKKAVSRTKFVCEDGELIQKAIEESIATGEARVARVRSAGSNEQGESVAEFFITWSFKARNK
jgi:acyl-coenzyme A thioesterase PaaI-like protein